MLGVCRVLRVTSTIRSGVREVSYECKREGRTDSVAIGASFDMLDTDPRSLQVHVPVSNPDLKCKKKPSASARQWTVSKQKLCRLGNASSMSMS